MASIKISQLPVGGSIVSTDELPVSRGGLETYRIKANQIVTTGGNVGDAAEVYKNSDTTIGSTTLNFRSLSGVGQGIQVIQTANTINISISGQNPIKTVFTGTGSQVDFPLSLTNTSSRNVNNYRVDIDGVLQEPGQTADYFLNGSNLTFTSAPPLSSKIVVVSNNLLPLVEPGNITATDTSFPRSLEDRFSDIINVKDFGAVGDGVTDDTAAIQAAINASNNVEPVLIPKGNYVLKSTITAFCPVIFNGVISVSSLSSVRFKLKSQPIVFNDYRKIYMGTEWTNPNSLLAGIALQRAVDELAESPRYHTLDGEGASIALGHSIKVNSFPALFGRFKTIQNLTVVLSAGFGIRDTTTQAVTTSAQAYAFDINAPTTSAFFGFSFNNVTIYGQKNGNGIYYGIQDNNQESSIVNCNFTNFYNKGIKSIHPLSISKCRLTGGEYNLRDADRITTGIELYAGDSEIIDTTVSYCKTGIYAEGASLTLMNVHSFNGSTDNESPILWVNNPNADMRATGCYFDNGPIWIYPLSSVSDTFGRCTFDSSVFTWAGKSAGNRSWIVAKPTQSGAKLRGIITTGCQFRDYRIYQRRFTYTGNGLSAAYISPLAKTTTGGSYTDFFPCGILSGSDLITVSSTNKYTPGLKVTGTGIPSNTVIDSIVDTTTLQLNNNATTTSPSATLTFSETVEVKINGTRTFNFTLSGIDYSNAQNPEQILTFTSPPPLSSNIVMVSKYFAVNPFEVDKTDGTVDPNDAWDIHVKDNSYYNDVTNLSSDIEPVLRMFSSPIIKIETNGVDTSYDVDWDWIVPFRLHISQIESIGWRCRTDAYVPPPSAIGYDYDTARRGKVTLSSPVSGYIMIKGHCAGFNDINVV